MNGILFKPPMIQAIVEGRKTQTRRLDGLKGINKGAWQYNGWAGSWQGFAFNNLPKPYKSLIIRPRYQPGDIVYIRETWASDCAYVIYKLGYSGAIVPKWRSPRFMPARFARYFIKITEVRYQRLQSITPEDCMAEGIHGYLFARGATAANPPDPRWAFIELWDSINPDYPWQSNPFVCAYSFVKVERPPEGFIGW